MHYNSNFFRISGVNLLLGIFTTLFFVTPVLEHTLNLIFSMTLESMNYSDDFVLD